MKIQEKQILTSVEDAHSYKVTMKYFRCENYTKQ